MQNIPNILSTTRLLLAPVFLFMYIQDALVWRSLSVAVFAVAAVTDYFDGKIARYYQVESDYGVFVDPLADKFLTFAGFLCLPFLDSSQFPWWAVGVILFRDIVITVLRLYAGRKNLEMKTRITAKIKTMVQMIFLYTVLLLGVFKESDIDFADQAEIFFNTGVLFYGMIIVTVITIYSGIEYLIMNPHLFRQEKRS
ncbi:CDP-alcohol phosphatidyltransferase family protein [Balneola sp. MJW-20]|uniref:CDP-alcohol phosphatidyltransferase family protein n=1 Tax=Gracilimonas aurantiaca TaxID=3234185 RepID=UPI0034674C97